MKDRTDAVGTTITDRPPIANHFRARLGLATPIVPRCNAPWASAIVEAAGSVHLERGLTGGACVRRTCTGEYHLPPKDARSPANVGSDSSESRIPPLSSSRYRGLASLKLNHHGTSHGGDRAGRLSGGQRAHGKPLQLVYISSTTPATPARTIATEECTQPVMDRNEGRSTYCDAYLVIDFSQRTVLLNSGVVELTSKEFELLALLAKHAGEVLPRGFLLSLVWGYSEQARTRTLDVHLARIRKKLGTLGHRYIETIFGAGCRFQPQTGCVAGTQTFKPASGHLRTGIG